jgi:hypothetical protein
MDRTLSEKNRFDYYWSCRNLLDDVGVGHDHNFSFILKFFGFSFSASEFLKVSV